MCGFGSVENVADFDPKKPCPECGTVATPEPASPNASLDHLTPEQAAFVHRVEAGTPTPSVERSSFAAARAAYEAYSVEIRAAWPEENPVSVHEPWERLDPAEMRAWTAALGAARVADSSRVDPDDDGQVCDIVRGYLAAITMHDDPAIAQAAGLLLRTTLFTRVAEKP